ncbi:MAG: TrkA family potassium uptake protein [Desulfovibrionaceae bacterium]
MGMQTRVLLWRRRFGPLWNLMAGAVYLLLIFFVGIVGFHVIEGWGLVDCFYMVVISLSTVGFMEVQPLSQAGRVFTSFFIIGGVGGFMYIAAAFTQMLVEGRLQMLWGKRRMQKTIDRLTNHFIICGYGRIGNVVAKEIHKDGHDLVVIEQDPELVQRILTDGFLAMEGDATDDKLLLSAGLRRARSLISALSSEAANVYVTLTARQLSPTINIVARASELSHITRLELAGANRVVMPHLIGGIRMAQNVLRPTVTNFLELAIRGGMDLQMEELLVGKGSELVGKDLMHSDIRPRFNLIIIAIKKRDGEMVYNPGPKEVIRQEDTLLVVGQKAGLHGIKAIL